jgi:hypothetical protein
MHVLKLTVAVLRRLPDAIEPLAAGRLPELGMLHVQNNNGEQHAYKNYYPYHYIFKRFIQLGFVYSEPLVVHSHQLNQPHQYWTGINSPRPVMPTKVGISRAKSQICRPTYIEVSLSGGMLIFISMTILEI